MTSWWDRVLGEQTTGADRARPRSSGSGDVSPADYCELLASFGEALGRIQDVVYLGGHGTPMVAGSKYHLTFYERGLELTSLDHAPCAAPYENVHALEASGPGAYQEGGGFIGGGFGTAAAEGMAIAGVLNALTSRTRIETVLRIAGSALEIFVSTDAATPDQLTIQLSPVRARLAPAAATRTPPSENTGSITGELERLAALRDSGALSDDEFASLKASLIERLGR